MSAAISTATGKLYGVERVCNAWEEPRSSYYGRKARSTKPVEQVELPSTELTVIACAGGWINTYGLRSS